MSNHTTPAETNRAAALEPDSRVGGAAMADSMSLVLYDQRTADRRSSPSPGFLGGYSGRTRKAYALDLRLFFAWCGGGRLRLFDAQRTTSSLTPASSKS